MTTWQAIRSLFQARNHVYKAEKIKDNLSSQPSPLILIPNEQLSGLSVLADTTVEYCRATRDIGKALLYTHAAIEAAIPSCGVQPYIPGVYFCRYLYPVGVALAVGETVYQAGSYLTSKQKPN